MPSACVRACAVKRRCACARCAVSEGCVDRRWQMECWMAGWMDGCSDRVVLAGWLARRPVRWCVSTDCVVRSSCAALCPLDSHPARPRPLISAASLIPPPCAPHHTHVSPARSPLTVYDPTCHTSSPNARVGEYVLRLGCARAAAAAASSRHASSRAPFRKHDSRALAAPTQLSAAALPLTSSTTACHSALIRPDVQHLSKARAGTAHRAACPRLLAYKRNI